MHLKTDLIETVSHVGLRMANKLHRLDIYKIYDLVYFNAEFVSYLVSITKVKDKTLKSLIEHAAIYTDNKWAKDICNKDLQNHKLYKYYLTHETSFCHFPKKWYSVGTKRKNYGV